MKIAFICVHNSCRSQMAEAFARVIGLGVFEAYSAGTHIGTKINPDAVAVMREIGVDMELQQRPKVLQDIPPVDMVVTMGCNVDCPYLPCRIGRIGAWMILRECLWRISAVCGSRSSQRFCCCGRESSPEC